MSQEEGEVLAAAALLTVREARYGTQSLLWTHLADTDAAVETSNAAMTSGG